MTDKNKSLSYGSEKEHWKRELKKIEKFRYIEGKKYENLNGVFPENYKGLKNERDETKSNFESNKYNISIQNEHEIRTIDKLKICDVILKKRISSVHKISNSEFIELYMEYDDYYASLIDTVNSSETPVDKYLFLTWETIKASFRILPDHFRGLTKKVFFPRFRFLFRVFQPGIVAVLHSVSPKCVFAFSQANTRQKWKTP